MAINLQQAARLIQQGRAAEAIAKYDQKVNLVHIALDPVDWCALVDYTIANNNRNESYYAVIHQLFNVSWRLGLPDYPNLIKEQQAQVADRLVKIAQQDPSLVGSILQGYSQTLPCLPDDVVIRCLRAQGIDLWRQILPSLRLCVSRGPLGRPAVLLCLREMYDEYLGYRKRCIQRVAQGEAIALESMPAQGWLSPKANVQSLLVAAIYFPFLITTHPQATSYLRRYPGWDKAQQLIPWLNNPDKHLAYGDARITPAIQEAVQAINSWPLALQYSSLAAELCLPKWALERPAAVFTWSEREMVVGTTKLCITPTTVASSRSREFQIYRLGPNLGIFYTGNRLSSAQQQIIRILEDNGLHLLQCQRSVPASDRPEITMFFQFVADAHWSKLRLPGELDPEFAKLFCHWLLPKAQLHEMSVVFGEQALQPEWWPVVHRYLPEYIPHPKITAQISA